MFASHWSEKIAVNEGNGTRTRQAELEISNGNIGEKKDSQKQYCPRELE